MSNITNHMRILGIVGSPRRNGNTEILIDEVLHGAEETGAEVEKVILSELDIRPCRACNACRKTGKCVQQDDMAKLLEQMQSNQMWVLGTPVYYFGPTAQFKAFIDRWYGGGTATFKGQSVVLVIPFEDPNINGARHTVGILEDTLAFKKMELLTTILAPGVLRPGEVRKHPDVLGTAHRAGREAVEMSY